MKSESPKGRGVVPLAVGYRGGHKGVMRSAESETAASKMHVSCLWQGDTGGLKTGFAPVSFPAAGPISHRFTLCAGLCSLSK